MCPGGHTFCVLGLTPAPESVILENMTTLADLLNGYIERSPHSSAGAVAQATGGAVSAGYLYKLLRGEKQNPSYKVIASLTKALNLSDPESEELFQAAGLDAEAVAERVDGLNSILERSDVLALVAGAAELVALGHPEDVKFLVDSARRLVRARDPHREIGAVFNDPTLTEHIKTFMREANI